MKLGILTVATGDYLEYWSQMIDSAQLSLKNLETEITFHVFTDRTKDAATFARKIQLFNFKIHEIPSYRWPEATLLRYRIIDKFKDQYFDDILMHLDADMLICADFINSINFEELIDGIGLVSHPGFWRPKGMTRVRLYFRFPKRLLIDMQRVFLLGGLGAWEIRKNSSAYVRRSDRRNYVCGGVWLGVRSNFSSLVLSCASNTELDLTQGEMAIWHDESHLNWWAARNKFTLLSPSYCYDPTYPQLASLPNLIQAVDKGQQRTILKKTVV